MRYLLGLLALLVLLIGPASIHAADPPSLARYYYAAIDVEAGDPVVAVDHQSVAPAYIAGHETVYQTGSNIATIVSLVPLTSRLCLINYQLTNGGYRLVGVRLDDQGNLSFTNTLAFGGFVLGLDDTHAVTANTAYGDLRLLTVDGNRLSMGPVTVTIVNKGTNIRLNRVASDRLMVSYYNSNYRAQLYRISGNTLLASGKDVVLPITGFSLSAYKLGNDRTLLSSGSSSLALMYSRDDTMQFLNLYSNSYAPVQTLGNARVLFRSSTRYYLGQVSDTGIEYGPAANSQISSPYLCPTPLTDSAYQMSSSGNQGGWITPSGTSLIIDPPQNVFDPLVTPAAKITAMDKDHLLVASLSNGRLSVHTQPDDAIVPNAGKYLGIAENDANQGEPCKVTLGNGVTRRFSGLSTGKTYYLGFDRLKLSSDRKGYVAGVAISPTELLVRYRDRVQ